MKRYFACVVCSVIYAIVAFPCFAQNKKSSHPDTNFYLKAIDINNNVITGVVKGEEISYRIDGFTSVDIKGVQGKPSDLKPGMKLVIPPMAAGSYVSRIQCVDTKIRLQKLRMQQDDQEDSNPYFKSIDMEHHQVTIVCDDEEIGYRIDEFTAVEILGALSKLSDLKPGMKLSMPPLEGGSYLNRIVCNDAKIYTEKLSPKKNEVKDMLVTVKSVKNGKTGFQMVVDYKGKERTYTVSKSTPIISGGITRHGNFGAIFPGEKLLLPPPSTNSPPSNALSYINCDAHLDTNFYLKSIDKNLITGVVLGEQQSYRIDEFTAVEIQGSLGKLSDLKPGMKLVIPQMTSGSYVKLIQCNDLTVHNDKLTVECLDDDGSIFLKSITPNNITVVTHGELQVYQINHATAVEIRGELGKLSDLKPGMKLIIPPAASSENFALNRSSPENYTLNRIICNDLGIYPVPPGRAKPKPVDD